MTSARSEKGLVVKSISGFYTVKVGDKCLSCKPRGIFRNQNISPLVGDNVLCETVEGSDQIVEILPRKNSWIRPPLANLDQLGIVLSTCEPSVSYTNVDILLTAAYYNNIMPFLLLTKTDLASYKSIASVYNSLSIPIFVMDDKNRGLEMFKERLPNKITALCGNSGVGKSTLLNKLLGFNVSETGEISQKLGRGRHTTRHVELFEVSGGYLADTPGFSSISFTQYLPFLEPKGIANYFPDFAPYRKSCKFLDCSHQKEAGCSVIKAVEEGKISKVRYKSYLKFYQELSAYKKSCRK